MLKVMCLCTKLPTVDHEYWQQLSVEVKFNTFANSESHGPGSRALRPTGTPAGFCSPRH